jgi:hypothetical protein
VDPNLLSVVVTIVDAGETLERCLRALASQQPPASLEVIVPYDDTVPSVPSIAARFPQVTFLPLGPVSTMLPAMSAGGQHELFDRRRAAGLARTTGGLVAILEDRGAPRPNWAAEARRLHSERPNAVIGGAIENGCDRPLNWAVYFCDFGRYQLPFEAGGRAWVSDVNVCYKRRAIDDTEPLWRGRYHEPVVHGALMRAGEVLWLSPALVVDEHRRDITLRALLRERIAWGRLFGSLRARDLPLMRRVALAALSPLLPFLLFLRHLRMQWTKRVTFGRFVAASPLVFVLLSAWSVGEMLGEIVGERPARSPHSNAA